MLAQLHASGLLQSLLLKYMQAAYARMQTAVIQVSLTRPTNLVCKVPTSIHVSHHVSHHASFASPSTSDAALACSVC